MEEFSKEQEDAFVKAIIDMVGDVYNDYPELISLLYDVDLLPEQINQASDALHMAAIVEAFYRGLKQQNPIPFGV